MADGDASTNAEFAARAGRVANSPTRLRDLLQYLVKVFGIGELLASIRDSRQEPTIPTELVMRCVLVLGLLRIRSFNALEPRLGEPTLQSALGLTPCNRKALSVDTLGYSLVRVDVETVRRTVVTVIRKAERNKVFREGSYGSLRFVAIDGWEPFSSRSRHCPACLTRQVRVGKTTVTEYYHSFVVAMMVDDRVDVVLDMEPVRSADARTDAGERDVVGKEGELTAAKRLVARLHETYERLIDVLLVDALYSNGPFLTLAHECHYGVIAVLKKDTDEPLKEALSLWRGKAPTKTHFDENKKEQILLWDCPGIQTLSTFSGPIRVVRANVMREGTDHTWCFAVTGSACRLSALQVLAAGRGRWHIENTAFHQWVSHWQFDHVFIHDGNAITAIIWLFVLAFNLLQVYLYRQIRSYGRDRGLDVTRTIVRFVDEMLDDLARVVNVLAWDTS